MVCSGQLGVMSGPEGPALVPGGFAAQARQALDNVTGLLDSQGLGWEHVVKTTAFLADIADFTSFNEIYVGALGPHRPARSVVAVSGLPMGALVEIEVWAHTGRAQS